MRRDQNKNGKWNAAGMVDLAGHMSEGSTEIEARVGVCVCVCIFYTCVCDHTSCQGFIAPRASTRGPEGKHLRAWVSGSGENNGIINSMNTAMSWEYCLVSV